MTMERERIQNAREKCLAGQVLGKEEIVALLNIPVGSDDDVLLRKTAREVAFIKTKGRGYLWAAVGTDFQPCVMSCDFCSMGEKWGLVKEGRTFSDDEIVTMIGSYAEGGADYTVLRTTEFFSTDKLAELARRIRKEIAGDYRIILNTGELEPETCDMLAGAGVYGIYHALRLREGEATPFRPEERVRTMKNVQASPLELISLTEPIGPEHTNEEIADRFLNTVDCGAMIGGVMARIPVKGTPLGETRQLSDDEIAHITAALRLSGGSVIQDFCVHPTSPEVLQSGANVVVVESGAIPRDDELACCCWKGFDLEDAKDRLRVAGYQLAYDKRLQGCSCTGRNLEKFAQPVILDIVMKNPGLNGYKIIKCMQEYSTFRQGSPDAAGIYRYLRQMEQNGIIAQREGLFEITPDGKACRENWRRTVENYRSSLGGLLEEMDAQ